MKIYNIIRSIAHCNADLCLEYGIEEKKLWRTVIAQTIKDLLCAKVTSHEYHEALYWLLYDDHDFNIVCDYADIDPVKLRLHALALRKSRKIKKQSKEYRIYSYFFNNNGAYIEQSYNA